MTITTRTALAVSTMSLLAASAVTTTAHGAVVLQDTYTPGATNGAAVDLGGVFGYEFNLDPGTEFSAAGHDKLILVYSGHDANASGTPNVTSVTYDGATLTEAIQDIDNGAIVNAGVWYLDNVASDGTLRIELSSGTTVESGFGLYAVDGLKTGVQDTGTGRTDSEVAANVPVNISTSEGFFVQEAARNNQSLAGDAGDDYLTLYNISEDSYRGLSQYQVTSGAGDYIAPINNNGGNNFRRVVSAGFEVVPEPSSLALLGLGGLLVARRRRG